MVFSIYTELCSHHHYLIPEHFYHLQKNPLYLLVVTPNHPSFQPLATSNLSVFMDQTISDTSYQWNHNPWPVESGFFHLLSMFPRFIRVSHGSVFHSFLRLIIFHGIDIPSFISPFTVCGHLGCFHLGAIMNKATTCIWTFIYIHTQVFVWSHVFISVGPVELLGHMVSLCLTLWGSVRVFSKVAAPF